MGQGVWGLGLGLGGRDPGSGDRVLKDQEQSIFGQVVHGSWPLAVQGSCVRGAGSPGSGDRGPGSEGPGSDWGQVVRGSWPLAVQEPIL